jgi:2-polyprenyl-3-methyl-5-hydroxy-6-metoxy-1,4-benzoquinol methylase
MKSKSLEMADYQEIQVEVRSLMRAQATFRGAGYTFNIPHNHRYWEYGAALAALREAKVEPPSRVLDVGCGHGPFGPWLAKLGYAVDEIDPSPSVATRSDLKPALEGLDWAFAGVSIMDFKTASPYSAVFAISVMEHIDASAQSASWAKLVELVAPGGLLFTTMDYGPVEAANASARAMIFTEERLTALTKELTDLGIVIEDLDPTYNGDEVFDYTFFRLVGRKEK